MMVSHDRTYVNLKILNMSNFADGDHQAQDNEHFRDIDYDDPVYVSAGKNIPCQQSLSLW